MDKGAPPNLARLNAIPPANSSANGCHSFSLHAALFRRRHRCAPLPCSVLPVRVGDLSCSRPRTRPRGVAAFDMRSWRRLIRGNCSAGALVTDPGVCDPDSAPILAAAFMRGLPGDLGTCERSFFLGKDAALPSPRRKRLKLLDWIISLSIAACLIALGVFSQSKMGTVRKKDQRPHQVPWGMIMIGCVFGLFLIVVHLMNLIGVETGPENSMFGRF